jgi:hypothetical protein
MTFRLDRNRAIFPAMAYHADVASDGQVRAPSSAHGPTHRLEYHGLNRKLTRSKLQGPWMRGQEPGRAGIDGYEVIDIRKGTDSFFAGIGWLASLEGWGMPAREGDRHLFRGDRLFWFLQKAGIY